MTEAPAVKPTATRVSRAEGVASTLEMEILRTGSPVGTRLGLRTDLIDRFEVSPGVLNEALRLLRDRDLITVKPGPNGGVFIADQPPGVRGRALDLWFQGLTIPPLDVFESRILLEELFNSLALTNATNEDHRRIESALRKMESDSEDPTGFFNANVEFHRMIARSTGVTVLVGVYESLVTVLTGALVRAAWTSGHAETVEHNVMVHRAIFEAIQSGDRKRLEEATLLHRVDMVNISDPDLSPINHLKNSTQN